MTRESELVTVVQGEFAVSRNPTTVFSTTLGSCVSVCLFDQSREVGGMNHFLLAMGQGNSGSDLKYGVNAMELLINRLIKDGASRFNLEAKVFGGARMTAHARDIGASNAAFALEFLEREGIPIRAKCVGGDRARRVQFVPTTGAARQLRFDGKITEIAPRPQERVPKSDVTLF